MNLIDAVLRQIAPGRALERARHRAALDALMRYDAAAVTERTRSLRGIQTDADTAAAQRARLAAVARDMVRNTPFAVRAQQVIASNVVGDGIIPKVEGGSEADRAALLDRIRQHFDTTDIDAAGRVNLYGLQRLMVNTIVDAGEVLVRFRPRTLSDGLALPFQLEVLEPEFLDTARDGTVPGGVVRDGIQYDLLGRRTGYWLFREHPHATGWRLRATDSRFVPADQVVHVFRQDRPGQNRGVSWFAPIALTLQDLADHQDAQLMRQKIAACFVAFRVSPDSDVVTASDSDPAGLSGMMVPGRIQNMPPGEDIRFASPPGVQAYDEFTSAVLRSVAAGMGLTYEALAGDLSRVNFSSARMGRMEMDRNVSAWQWLMMVPQFLQPLARWTLREAELVPNGRGAAAGLRLAWVPPTRILVDPAREIGAMVEEVQAGFASRQGVIRRLGYDPDEILAEQAEDARLAQEQNLSFTTDARAPRAAPQRPVEDDEPAEDDEDARE